MSETYQSRVFTFISNRTNQLKNSCAKSLRHLKVAVVWSGQILLYPLQLLAQTKIFHPHISSPPPKPELPQPVPDINIEQALDLVEVAGYPIQIAQRAPLVVDDWSFIDEDLWNTAHGNTSIKSQEIAYSPRTSRQVTPPKPIIQGLSSLLADRQLVLVTAKNELLNILTPAQQQEIRRRIGIDLATTWERYQLLVNYPPQELSSNQQLFLNHDTTIADTDEELNLLLPSRLTKESPKLFDRLRNWWQNSMVESTQLETSSQSGFIPPKAIQPQQQLAPSAYKFTPQPPRLDRYLELPQLPPIFETSQPPAPESKVKLAMVNIATKIQPDWLKNWWNYYREYIYIPLVDLATPIEDDDLADLTLEESAIVHVPAEFKLTPIEPPPSQIRAKKQDKIAQSSNERTSKKQRQIEQTSSIQIKTKSDRHLEYHQDWIEAEAETMGYSQSPFARLLVWLDRLMFRLENWIFAAIDYPVKIMRQWFRSTPRP